jgi:hypothetical protein
MLLLSALSAKDLAEAIVGIFGRLLKNCCLEKATRQDVAKADVRHRASSSAPDITQRARSGLDSINAYSLASLLDLGCMSREACH